MYSVKDYRKRIKQWKVQNLLVLFFIGLGIFLSIIHFLAPITLTSGTVAIIFYSTLSLAGILIAHVGVLLAIYHSRNLRRTEAGKKYEILLWLLTLSVIIGFATSLLAFYSLANPECKILLTVLPLLFCTIIYMTIVIVPTTVITILWGKV
jgi:hypothetical protein